MISVAEQMVGGQNGLEIVKCSICGDENAIQPFPWGNHHLNLMPSLQVMQCTKCGLKFLSPRPDAEARRRMMQGTLPENLRVYDNSPADYAAVTDTRTRIFEKRVASISKLLCSSAMNNLLDIGASSGRFVSIAQKAGFHAVGIEPSLGGTQTALARGLQFPQGVAENLPFASQTFDIVHAHHVFEHLANPMMAAREIWRVLKPGGLLYIEVPNQLDNIMFMRDRLFHRIPQRKRTIRSIHHLWFFSSKSLNHLLQVAGFQNIEWTDYYSWQAGGWRTPFSLLTRLIGCFLGGGDRLQAYGWKGR